MKEIRNILLKIASENPSLRKKILRIASDVDPTLLKWLVARTKKAKGIVQISVVEQAFKLMPGWSITNTITYYPLKDYDDRDIFKSQHPEWTTQWGARITSTEPAGGLAFIFTPETNIEEAKNQLEKQIQRVSGKTPSGSAQIGMDYATSAEPLSGYMKDSNGFQLSKVWVGVPGWIITAPNGVSKTLPSPINRKGKPLDPNRLEKFASFWTFLYKNGVDLSAKEALQRQDQQQIEDLSLPSAQRKKVQQSRTLLPEVEKLLRKIVDKKFQEVWDTKTDMYIQALKRFLGEQEKSWEIQKEKGVTKLRFSTYQLYKEIKYLSYFDDFFREVTMEDEDRIRPYVSEGWVKRKGNYLDIARSFGKRLAEEMREEFVHKNGYKLSTIIRTKGNLQDSKLLRINSGSDFGGEIQFIFADGSSFIVRNKMIFKLSSLGKPHNQFPTTFHDVILPDGSNMSNPSEERMVEVFAIK